MADALGKKYLSEKERAVVADHPTSDGAHLTPEHIAERAALIRDLIDGGYTPERVEAQFARSFHAEDWELIRAAYTPVPAQDV